MHMRGKGDLGVGKVAVTLLHREITRQGCDQCEMLAEGMGACAAEPHAQGLALGLEVIDQCCKMHFELGDAGADLGGDLDRVLDALRLDVGTVGIELHQRQDAIVRSKVSTFRSWNSSSTPMLKGSEYL